MLTGEFLITKFWLLFRIIFFLQKNELSNILEDLKIALFNGTKIP
jgi:hypothetical protein